MSSTDRPRPASGRGGSRAGADTRARPAAHDRPTAGTRTPRRTLKSDLLAGADAITARRDSARPARAGSGGGGGRPDSGGGRSRPPRPPRGLGLANSRRRVRVIFLVALFVFTVFAAQLVRLQGIDAGQVAAEAQKLRSDKTTVPAQRGTLLDNHGVPVAQSVERFDIVADQAQVATYAVTDPKTKKSTTVGAAGAAKALAPLLGIDQATLTTELTGTKVYVQLLRKAEPAVWRKVAALKIPGIAKQDATERTYPAGAALAPLIGWVGPDGAATNNAGGGLELLLNKQLTGTPGETTREYSLDGRVIPMGASTIKPAVPGQDVQLTIDNDLSWYAYNAIAAQVKAAEAESGSVVVMDRQGRIRAVAQAPSFDPVKRQGPANAFSSMPFQDVFEPGSTAKVMSLGAAMDQGLITPTSAFTVPDQLKRSIQMFRDSHPHPTEVLTVAGILAQSSNVGTIMASEAVKPDVLERYYRAFGMGQSSAVQFPGESKGLLKPNTDWDALTRYTLLFGQGLSITAVQDAGVFQAIANGGVRIPPTIVEGTRQSDGTLVPAQLPQGNRVISSQTADQLSLMLEGVVGPQGTAAQAGIAGIPVAGKTGTAQRLGTKTGGYTASFIGFAPADKPELIVAVVLQNPKKGYYGGTMAGPVFQQVMSYALQRYGVAPTGVTRTPYPLRPGEKPSANAERVDPGTIALNGQAQPDATLPQVTPTQDAPSAQDTPSSKASSPSSSGGSSPTSPSNTPATPSSTPSGSSSSTRR